MSIGSRTSRRKRRQLKPVTIPYEARVAITQGVTRDEPVADLQYLGLAPRNINILENSKYQITTLKQLVSRKREELLDIPTLGANGVSQLLQCLARYHELEEARKRLDEDPERLKPKWFRE